MIKGCVKIVAEINTKRTAARFEVKIVIGLSLVTVKIAEKTVNRHFQIVEKSFLHTYLIADSVTDGLRVLLTCDVSKKAHHAYTETNPWKQVDRCRRDPSGRCCDYSSVFYLFIALGIEYMRTQKQRGT